MNYNNNDITLEGTSVMLLAMEDIHYTINVTFEYL